ncbi:MAG: hypothetical protein IPN93_15415 [Bacteroidetes bacterium]|nr:hypothetical protein [Bacteroidota bacterium]
MFRKRAYTKIISQNYITVALIGGTSEPLVNVKLKSEKALSILITTLQIL